MDSFRSGEEAEVISDIVLTLQGDQPWRTNGTDVTELEIDIVCEVPRNVFLGSTYRMYS